MKIWMLILMILFVVSCSTHDKDEPVTALTPTAMPLPTDAEIANALMTANTEEMNMAKLATKRAQNKEVRAFASMMLKEHGLNNNMAIRLAKTNGIAPAETGTTEHMKLSAQTEIERLKLIKGKEFDTAYMDCQVSMHRDVLDKLDSTLIPNAQNAELKAMLQDTRGKVEEHLNHAQMIRQKL